MSTFYWKKKHERWYAWWIDCHIINWRKVLRAESNKWNASKIILRYGRQNEKYNIFIIYTTFLLAGKYNIKSFPFIIVDSELQKITKNRRSSSIKNKKWSSTILQLAETYELNSFSFLIVGSELGFVVFFTLVNRSTFLSLSIFHQDHLLQYELVHPKGLLLKNKATILDIYGFLKIQ